MIFEHEIPDNSKLYFLSSAKQKRKIERIAAEILYDDGFEEIVTPLFSYHQHLSILDDRELIRVNDTMNHNMTVTPRIKNGFIFNLYLNIPQLNSIK